jgi:hypothetical protein
MPQVRSSFLYFHPNLSFFLKVISGGDLEQRAVACLTFARCIIVAGNSTREPFICRHVLPTLTYCESFCFTGSTFVRIHG